VINPTRYLDLNTCVIGVAAEVLWVLRRNQVMPYAELLAAVQSRTSEAVRFNFPLSLDFLYLVGQIDYDDDADAIVLADLQSHAVGGNR
jgi:hypothetical protein